MGELRNLFEQNRDKGVPFAEAIADTLAVIDGLTSYPTPLEQIVDLQKTISLLLTAAGGRVVIARASLANLEIAKDVEVFVDELHDTITYKFKDG